MATEISREVAEKVAAAMVRADISKSRLADLTGIPYSTLGRKLLATTDFTFPELWQIAQATGAKASDFVPRQFISDRAVA